MQTYETWFDSIYYKILYQNRDEYEAQEFIENLLVYLQPLSGSKMLDIACGEGRYAKHLADQGFDVTGIDISHHSIETAKSFENDNLHFFIQDMRFSFYINYFDYAFNFFTSFGYFTHSRDHILAAKAFGDCLKENGILIMDYLNYEQVLSQLVPEETIHRGSYYFHIKRKLIDKLIIKEIDFIDADGRKRHYQESVAAFSLSDFIEMFKLSGLNLVGAFGDYALNSFNPLQSPRLIMVFKKK